MTVSEQIAAYLSGTVSSGGPCENLPAPNLSYFPFTDPFNPPSACPKNGQAWDDFLQAILDSLDNRKAALNNGCCDISHEPPSWNTQCAEEADIQCSEEWSIALAAFDVCD